MPAAAAPVDASEKWRFAHDPAQAGFDGIRTGVAAFLAGGTLASCVKGDWKERVEAALADAGAQTLSKAARLSRRLRRTAAMFQER